MFSFQPSTTTTTESPFKLQAELSAKYFNIFFLSFTGVVSACILIAIILCIVLEILGRCRKEESESANDLELENVETQNPPILDEEQFYDEMM